MLVSEYLQRVDVELVAHAVPVYELVYQLVDADPAFSFRVTALDGAGLPNEGSMLDRFLLLVDFTRLDVVVRLQVDLRGVQSVGRLHAGFVQPFDPRVPIHQNARYQFEVELILPRRPGEHVDSDRPAQDLVDNLYGVAVTVLAEVERIVDLVEYDRFTAEHLDVLAALNDVDKLLVPQDVELAPVLEYLLDLLVVVYPRYDQVVGENASQLQYDPGLPGPHFIPYQHSLVLRYLGHHRLLVLTQVKVHSFYGPN